MLIKLTHSEGRRPFYMKAIDVRGVEEDLKNPLETIVITNLMTPTGPQAYKVLEGMDTVAKAVEEALAKLK